MEGVEVSPPFTSTSPSVPSPTASHIAHLCSSRLQIRSLTTLEVTHSFPLPSSHDLRHSRIAWSPPTLASLSRPSSTCTPPRRSSRPPPLCSHRILVTDAENTRVYDLRDEKWTAVISNGTGGMGSVAHAEFGAGEDEVFVWSDFCAAVKVWCLKSGRSVEVRDPKFIGRDGRGWGVRPGSAGQATSDAGVVALLCRSAGLDVLMLLAPRTYEVLNRVELPTTDAAGLRWSRDGHWLAIWDAASAGHKLYIYTADGHLYKTVTREPADEANEWSIEGLGIKSVEWVPGNSHLAIGGWDGRVRILSARTFAPVVFLDHTPVIDVPNAPVYTELVDGQGKRSYTLTPQPTTPPKAPLDKNETGLMKQGISLVSFNADGTLCATRDDATPSTVWIWDVRSLTPRTICIQFAPVKTLLWHPTDTSRLLIQTAHNSPTVYLYTAPNPPPCASANTTTTTYPSPSHQQNPPSILLLSSHLPKPSSVSTTTAAATTTTNSASSSLSPPKYQIHWLPSATLSPATTAAPGKKPLFALSHQQGYILVWPEGKDAILRFERESGEGEESDDSLFEILTGRRSVGGDGDGDVEESLVGLEDTFRGVRARREEEQEEMGRLDVGGDGAADEDEEEEEEGKKVYGHGNRGGNRNQGHAGVGLGESGLDEMF